MTVTSVHKDPEALTMTITAEFDAPVEQVWQMWADPRQLERWWGPPTYPATVVDHDLTPGGRVTYFMTGPEGDKPRLVAGARGRRAAPPRVRGRLRRRRRRPRTRHADHDHPRVALTELRTAAHAWRSRPRSRPSRRWSRSSRWAWKRA